MANTKNDTANQLLKLVVLRDKFEKRIDYGELHSLQYYTKELIRSVGKITEAARVDGFKEDEIETMLAYYEEVVKQELKDNL